MRVGLRRRVAVLETALQTRDEPAREGLATLVAWAKRHPPTEVCDIDVDLDGERPPRGLARLVWEARHDKP
jgi:hypothetical protein